MPNNITYDQTDTRVNGTTEKEFDELGKELTEEKFKLRQNSLRLLMANFGSTSPATAIYECAHEWCEKQYTTNGIKIISKHTILVININKILIR